MNFKRNIAFIMEIVLILYALSACGSNTSSPVGNWYNEKGKCLDIRQDGSWKLEDSYGTGTWKKLNDDIIEFTDFYGDTQESKISEDEFGKYIDFGYYGDFYKDAYPTEEKISEVKKQNTISINPFDGIKYEINGISPYCKISINNQGCTNEAQKYITYNFDKDFYKNGESATITAVLSTNTGEETYVLSEENSEFKVSGQAEYVTSAEQIDMGVLEKEVTDKINALISSSVGTEKMFNEDIGYNIIFNTDEWRTYRNQSGSNWGGPNISAVTSDLKSIYFSSLKSQKENQFSETFPYNMLSFVYCFDISTDNIFTIDGNQKDVNITGKMYVNIFAKNIVKKPDGSMHWNDERCDFNAFTSFDGIDNLTSNTIMSNSDNYNITKVIQ